MKEYIGLLIVTLFLAPTLANASILYNQSVNLSPGWNIVSTPKVLESHSFSEEETSDNFDIYILDASKTSGWSTLADLNQTEFTPLFGYFINNKTGIDQTLTFDYKDVSIPEQLFSRIFSIPGWYSIGIANSTYAKNINSDNTDTNNPDHILNSMIGSSVHYGDVIDFSDANYATNKNSVAVVNPWRNVARSAEISNNTEINSLNDLRETKGYAVYIKDADTNYSGLQNTTIPQCSDGIDNDGDGFIDMYDTGCSNPADDNETLPTLSISSSPNNPSASILLVDENQLSSSHLVFVFEVEAEDSDIGLEELILTVEMGTENYNVVVDDVKIGINGQEFNNYSVTNGDSQLATLTFDLNGDYLLNADTPVEITVMITFKDQNGAYVSGSETIQVTATEISGGGISDTSTITSEIHTLSLTDFDVAVTSKSATTNEDDSIGFISFDFQISTNDGDVVFNIADNNNVNGLTDDITFDVLGVDPTIAVANLSLISGDAVYSGNSWTISEGDNATFTIDFILATANAGDNGVYRVRLETIAGITLDDLSSLVTLVYQGV